MLVTGDVGSVLKEHGARLQDLFSHCSPGVEEPPAALPSASAALGVWLRPIRSASSHQGQTAGEHPPNAGKLH